MRRIAFVFLFTVVSLVVNADIAKSVMLHHNGQVKLYDYNEVQKAVDDAVDGDTIYLTQGTFAPFNINKRIMVRGAGSGTIIEGDCTINISGEEKLHMPVLDAISFSGNVNVASAYRQFTLRKCKMQNLNFTGAEFHDAKMDRCFVFKTFNLTKNVREFNAIGSKIAYLHPDDHTDGQLVFEHCNIYTVNDTISATFISSVVYRSTTNNNVNSCKNFVGCVFISCGVSSNNVGTDNTNIDTVGYVALYENCEHNGASGTSSVDGTKVGCYGGQYPFTLEPELPKVTKHVITLDAANKKLNVTLTVDKK